MSFELDLIIKYLYFDLGCYYMPLKAHGKKLETAALELGLQALKRIVNHNAILSHLENSSIEKIEQAQRQMESHEELNQVESDVEWVSAPDTDDQTQNKNIN